MKTTAERRSAALDYIAAHHVMTVATHGKDGLWAAAVFYASSDFDFYFLSAAHTRHAQNFVSHPHIAATIQADYDQWPAIKGIQLEGDVIQLENVPRETAIARYCEKYPFIKSPDSVIGKALNRVNWYRLRATTVYFIDNELGFGHRDRIAI